MSDLPDDAFSPDERKALDAWSAPRAPADFASRVLAIAQPQKKSRLPGVVAAIAALVIAAVTAGALLEPENESSGKSASATRATLSLGKRAVAVAEPNAALSWVIATDGDAAVTQQSGNVFYRVEPGGAFTVQTPAGTARVMGTCFRVEVVDMNASSLKGAVVGAALSAIAVVTVYEGKVVAGSGSQELTVPAGEAAVLEPTGPRRVEVVTSPIMGTPPVRGTSGSGAAGEPTPGRPGAATTEVPGPQQVAALQQEAMGLRDRVHELEASLKDLKNRSNREKTYDLPQEDLLDMVQKCELRWDYPGGDATKAPTVADDDAKKVGLTQQQQQAVDALLATYNQQLIGQIRGLYTEMTHDPSAGSMGVQSMIDEAYDKTAPVDRQTAFQNLARERAGLQPASAQSPAFERLYRLFQGSGDSLEQQMGAVIGAERAHAYRDLHGGYGSKHRSSSGCPPDAAQP